MPCKNRIVIANHHLLHVDRARARGWSRQEVVSQWCRLFVAPPLVERWLRGEAGEAEQAAAEALIEKWRERLSDISCFMRCLNEHMARRANLEDNCKCIGQAIGSRKAGEAQCRPLPPMHPLLDRRSGSANEVR